MIIILIVIMLVLCGVSVFLYHLAFAPNRLFFWFDFPTTLQYHSFFRSIHNQYTHHFYDTSNLALMLSSVVDWAESTN